MIEELLKEEKYLLERLSHNRKKQRELYTERFCSRTGVKIGDTVSFMDGRKRTVGIIHRFIYSGQKPMHPVVLILKKDGTPGKLERRIWLDSLGTIEVLNPKK